MQTFSAGSAGQPTVTKALPDHSDKHVRHILEEVSTTSDDIEKDSPVSEYWTKELPVKRKSCSTRRFGE